MAYFDISFLYIFVLVVIYSVFVHNLEGVVDMCVQILLSRHRNINIYIYIIYVYTHIYTHICICTDIFVFIHDTNMWQ